MKKEVFSLDEKFLASYYPDYAFKLHKILNAYNSSKDKGYRIAKELVKTSNRLSAMTEKFKKQYANSGDYLEALYDIMNYLNKGVKKTTTYVNIGKVSPERAQMASIIQKIYNSGLSILDYYFYNTTPLGINTYFCDKVSHKDKIALEIKERRDTTYPIILDIIDKINNKELDYVGYYEITKLNPYYLIAIAKDNNLFTEDLARFISLLRANNQLDVERELNGTLVINEEKIPRVVKEQAIEYIKSIDAPMDALVYESMIKRLIRKSK